MDTKPSLCEADSQTTDRDSTVNETTTRHPCQVGRRLPQRVRMVTRVWLAYCDRLPLGWLGALLACLGGALATSAWTALSGGVAPASLMARVGVSYAGAAVVVTLLFPLLPTCVHAIAKSMRRGRGKRTSRFPVRH
jgi:hypothetical protein